jgi:hypothetical protein
LATFYSQRTAAPTWQDAAATYHALYVTETLTDVAETASQAGIRLQGNAARLGQTIAPGHIDVVSGLTLKRSQLLGFEGRPLLQIAYLSENGAPVALCIMKSENAKPSNVRTATLQGMASARWAKDGFEYLLIGGADKEAIETAARTFATLL